MDAKRLLVGIRRWPLGRIALVAAAALPFLASLGFCSVNRTPRKPTGVVDRPSLVFDQYFVNLSELHNAARVEAWYHFKNTRQNARPDHEPRAKLRLPQSESRKARISARRRVRVLARRADDTRKTGATRLLSPY